MKKQVAKSVGWDEENVSSGGFAEKPDQYKGKKGVVDTIRIMSHPISFYGARVSNENTDKGFFAVSLANHDDSLAAEQGDAEALERCKAACPLYKRGFAVKRRFALLVVHHQRKSGKGQVRVDRPYPWVIDGAKYNALRETAQALPVSPKTNKRVPLGAIEIRVSCDDTSFQKLSFVAVTTKADLVSSYKDALALCADVLEDENDPNSECDLVQAFITPEPLIGLEQSIARIMGGSGGDDGGLVEREPAGKKSGKRSKSSKTNAPSTDDEIESELDSILDSVGGDDDEDGDDDLGF